MSEKKAHVIEIRQKLRKISTGNILYKMSYFQLKFSTIFDAFPSDVASFLAITCKSRFVDEI